MKTLRTIALASLLSLASTLPALAAEQPEDALVEKCSAMMKEKELMRTMMKTMPHDEMMECHRMMQNKNKAKTDTAEPEHSGHEHDHGE